MLGKVWKRVDYILKVNHLQTVFDSDDGRVVSVDDVSFSIKPGEIMGIVGESGCGKSVTSLSILRLLGNKGKITKGEILFAGTDLLKLSDQEICKIRGNDISMIFQEPMTSLNPVFTVGHQIAEALRLHFPKSKSEARLDAIELLEKVGLPRADKMINEYPHSLSGGMRQRVMIAMALACQPKLIIADEPTTALDVTIQAQILDLMKKLRVDLNTAIMLITHDLGVVAEMADRVIVMYAGQVVEEADVFTLFDSPEHPYTQGLMRSIPQVYTEKIERLMSIPGTVPSAYHSMNGCRFNTRCPLVTEQCQNALPPLIDNGFNHKVRCWNSKATAQVSQEAIHGCR